MTFVCDAASGGAVGLRGIAEEAPLGKYLFKTADSVVHLALLESCNRESQFTGIKVAKLKKRPLVAALNAKHIGANLKHAVYRSKDSSIRVIHTETASNFKLDVGAPGHGAKILDLAVSGGGTAAAPEEATVLIACSDQGWVNIFVIDGCQRDDKGQDEDQGVPVRSFSLVFEDADKPSRVFAHPTDSRVFFTLHRDCIRAWDWTLLPDDPDPATVMQSSVQFSVDVGGLIDAVVSVDGAALFALSQGGLVTVWRCPSSTSFQAASPLQRTLAEGLSASFCSLRALGGSGDGSSWDVSGADQVLVAAAASGCELFVYRCEPQGSAPLGRLLQHVRLDDSRLPPAEIAEGDPPFLLDVASVAKNTLTLAQRGRCFVLVLPLAAGWRVAEGLPFPYMRRLVVARPLNQLSTLSGKCRTGWTHYVYCQEICSRKEGSDEVETGILVRQVEPPQLLAPKAASIPEGGGATTALAAVVADDEGAAAEAQPAVPATAEASAPSASETAAVAAAPAVVATNGTAISGPPPGLALVVSETAVAAAAAPAVDAIQGTAGLAGGGGGGGGGADPRRGRSPAVVETTAATATAAAATIVAPAARGAPPGLVAPAGTGLVEAARVANGTGGVEALEASPEPLAAMSGAPAAAASASAVRGIITRPGLAHPPAAAMPSVAVVGASKEAGVAAAPGLEAPSSASEEAAEPSGRGIPAEPAAAGGRNKANGKSDVDWGMVKQIAVAFLKGLDRSRGSLADKIVREVAEVVRAGGVGGGAPAAGALAATGSAAPGDAALLEQTLAKVREARAAQADAERSMQAAAKKAAEKWAEESQAAVSGAMRLELGQISDGVANSLARELVQSKKFCEALTKGVQRSSGTAARQAVEALRAPKQLQSTVAASLGDALHDSLGDVLRTELRTHLEKELVPLVNQRVSKMVTAFRDRMGECLEDVAAEHEAAARRLGTDLAPVLQEELRQVHRLVAQQRAASHAAAAAPPMLPAGQLDELAQTVRTEVVQPLHGRIRELTVQVHRLQGEIRNLEHRFYRAADAGRAALPNGIADGSHAASATVQEAGRARALADLVREGRAVEAFGQALRLQDDAQHEDFVWGICDALGGPADFIGGEGAALAEPVKMGLMLALARSISSGLPPEGRHRRAEWISELFFAFGADHPDVRSTAGRDCQELGAVLDAADLGREASEELRMARRSIAQMARLLQPGI